jgi:hypothetical protein
MSLHMGLELQVCLCFSWLQETSVDSFKGARQYSRFLGFGEIDFFEWMVGEYTADNNELLYVYLHV